MNYGRGDVVLVFYPFASGIGGGRRPVLIVQNDADNQRMRNTIVTQITTNLARSGEATQFLIEVATPDGKQSGLLHDSVISANNLATIEDGLIQRKIGALSAASMKQVDNCLKAALGLP
jgi:mRNA interferase MazF